MKAYILYHPQSDHARSVEEFAHNFKQLQGKDIEKVSLETRDGAEMATAYDIMDYPAILIVNDTSKDFIKCWQGASLPALDDVASYLQQ